MRSCSVKGGLVGYEPGKEEAEREARERVLLDNNGSFFGGGSCGDFGGGNMDGVAVAEIFRNNLPL